MNVLEDQVRRVLQETAGDISPLDVPPLRLPPAHRVPAERLGRSRLGGRRDAGWLGGGWQHGGWPGWLAPLAAAAAVIAVLAASLAITRGAPSRRPGPRPASPLAGVPPYYVTLTARTRTANAAGLPVQQQQAVIRATATGRVVGTVTAPRPYNTLTAVAAAASAGRYVLSAERMVTRHHSGGTYIVPVTAARFYLLHVDRDGHVSKLAPLPIPRLPAGTDGSGIALSPDGRKLAIAVRDGGPRNGPEIIVDTLATGAQQVWTWPGGGPITNNAGGLGQVLSWAADGRTLAFQQWAGNSIEVRLLDTAAPGRSLAASKLALDWAGEAENFRFVHGRAANVIFGFSALLTPDGSKIVCATATETRHPLRSVLSFTEFSARTGKVVAVLGRWRLTGMYPGQTQDVLWTNASGRTLIVLAHQPGVEPARGPYSNSANYRTRYSVLRGDQYTPIPGAPPAGGLGTWPAW
jgi:WD40-like Beta Propeller Repeat